METKKNEKLPATLPTLDITGPSGSIRLFLAALNDPSAKRRFRAPEITVEGKSVRPKGQISPQAVVNAFKAKTEDETSLALGNALRLGFSAEVNGYTLT